MAVFVENKKMDVSAPWPGFLASKLYEERLASKKGVQTEHPPYMKT